MKLTPAGLAAVADLEAIKRKSLVQYLVGWKESEGKGWRDAHFESGIEQARRQYDLGKCEIVHCLTPKGVVLLAIPRKVQILRPSHQRFTQPYVPAVRKPF